MELEERCWSGPRYILSRFESTFVVPLPLAATYVLITMAQEMPVTAVRLLLINDLHLNLTQQLAYYALTFIPWSWCKPLIGVLSDHSGMMGYRRRPFILLGCAGTSLMYVLMGFYAHSYASICVLGTALATCFVCALVGLDARSVEVGNSAAILTSLVPLVPTPSTTHDVSVPLLGPCQDTEGEAWEKEGEVLETNMGVHERGGREMVEEEDVERRNKAARAKAQSAVQAACMFFRSFGSLLASFTAIFVLKAVSTSKVLLCCAFLPLLAALCSLCDGEAKWTPPVQRATHLSPSQRFCNGLSLYYNAVRRIWFPLVFLFIYSVGPTTIDVYPTFIFDRFSFEPWELQLQSFLGLTFACLGSLFYWKFCTHISIHKVFVVGTLFATLGSTSNVLLATGHTGIPPAYFIPIDGAVVTFLSRVALLPTMVMASQHCPAGLEGTGFTLLGMSTHLAGLLSAPISAALAALLHLDIGSWDNLWMMILICCGCNLLPLLFVPCLKRFSTEAPTDETPSLARHKAGINDVVCG